MIASMAKESSAPVVSPLLRKNDIIVDAVSAFLLPTNL